jgi:Xaa-Pro aminopeptidase
VDLTHRRAQLLSSIAPGSAYFSTDPVAIRYLTGFTGSSATIALGHSGTVFVTDGRYRDQATLECPGITPVIDRNGLAKATEEMLRRGVQQVSVAPSTPSSQVDQLRTSFTKVNVWSDDPVVALRQVKDSDELAALREACAITAASLMELARHIRAGDREIDIARRLEAEFGRRGAEDRAFPTIVATGIHSAIPHHRPTSTALAHGDLLVIDCGARVRGYHADMTRTFIVGEDLAEWQREIHAVVSEAATRGRDSVRPDVRCADVDAAARDVISARGYAEAFTHGTGHAVGLVIHEAPMLMRESLGTLAAGMAVTVEPGIYLPRRGGVRIEDTLEITSEGNAVLTEAPRGLMRVG